jgi:hypothetical protein
MNVRVLVYAGVPPVVVIYLAVRHQHWHPAFVRYHCGVVQKPAEREEGNGQKWQ